MPVVKKKLGGLAWKAACFELLGKAGFGQISPLAQVPTFQVASRHTRQECWLRVGASGGCPVAVKADLL
jgi:hypothetical protein